MLQDKKAKAEPVPISIGSLEDAFVKIPGQITALNAVDISPFKESDLETATDGSLLSFMLDKGTLPLMLRARLAAQSNSVTVKLRKAKNEAKENTTSYEKFYDFIAEVTFSTSASAIAAERGGYYADTFAIVSDESLKGIGSEGTLQKVTYLDVLGFLSQAIECTGKQTAWAEFDITNA